MLQRKRPSQRAANVSYYWRNRDIEIARVRLRQDGTVHMLRELRNVPCADCGGRFEPHQMDFDHRDPSTKSFNVMTGRAIEKCDIVCANCHRVRTRDADAHKLTDPTGYSGRQRMSPQWQSDAALLDSERQHPCADCRASFPPCAMDFDHRDPATKRYTVTRMRGRARREEILAEIAKCDIVCANCHRLRTSNRREAKFAERE